MAKYEEAIVIVDVDILDHSLKRKSTNTKQLVKVNAILPILYRDNADRIALQENLQFAAHKKDCNRLNSLSGMLERNCSGIISKQNAYIYEGINNGSMPYDRIISQTQYICINNFSLLQYQANWVEKALHEINVALVDGRIKAPNDLFPIQQRLYAANSYLKNLVKNKVDLPVFNDTQKALSSFQNRGSEIRSFRSTYQDTHETIFILHGFSGIGKSALIERLKNLYYFQTIERSIPNSGGFESFLRVLEELAGIRLNWNTFSDDEIEQFAIELAKALSIKYKTIIVVKSIGRIFDQNNADKSLKLISALARKLNELQTKVKIIIEINRKPPEHLQHIEYVKLCKLDPLSNQYIGRLIEQITTQLTYNISLPQLANDIITECKGNPNVAKLIGVYLAEKINKSGDQSIKISEVESFIHSYVDGIFTQLMVSDKERILLSEMSIYRIAVGIKAYERLPSYNKEIFEKVLDKMMVEETSEGFKINPLVGRRLGSLITNQRELHIIASEYYEEEYNKHSWLTAKAEYFYHASFFNPSLKTKDVRFYSDDILSAAEELCQHPSYIGIALSHLQTIYPWKKGYWKYHLILAYCFMINEDYSEYCKEFELAVKTNKRQPEVSYYLMIKKLIRARKQNEVEKST